MASHAILAEQQQPKQMIHCPAAGSHSVGTACTDHQVIVLVDPYDQRAQMHQFTRCLLFLYAAGASMEGKAARASQESSALRSRSRMPLRLAPWGAPHHQIFLHWAAPMGPKSSSLALQVNQQWACILSVRTAGVMSGRRQRRGEDGSLGGGG